MKVVAIEELMWSYHPLPKDWVVVPFDDKKTIESADVLVQSNIKECKKEKKIGSIYQYVIDSNKPYICVESAVFRKNMPDPPHPKAYHRFSWTSYFRDEGNYNNKNCPSDRWEQIQQDQNIEIKPWRNNGEYVLVILQRPGDSSLKNLLARYNTYDNFLTQIIQNIRANTNKPIRIRMHPLRQDRQLEIINRLNISGVELSPNTDGASLLNGGDGLQKDFDNAWAVVGFNSNALTESICEGIPTFSLCPSSMAWDCSNTDLKMLDNPQTFERQQWLNNLGYCQWREDECVEGLPWHHLKRVYFK
jgi:hypothetical protein